MLTTEMEKLEEEMDAKVVTSSGYTRGELKAAFAKLTEGMENWKMPIHTVIHISEWTLMREACEFFTASTLYQIQDLGEGKMYVMADGYYKTVGA